MEQDLLAGAFGTVILIFLIVLAILWSLLPFAVFGTKGRLDQLIQQNKQLITLLQNSNIETVDIGDIKNIEETNVEPEIKQPKQVYNTATGKMESEE